MSILEKDGPEEIVYQGKIFEVVKQSMKFGKKKASFEIARRSPGVRLIIVDNDKMLLTKEYRPELEDYDYRLPGGKVFDTLAEYKYHINDNILPFAEIAAKREAKEEAGLIINSPKYFATARSGSTISWDLIYFVIDNYKQNTSGQELETGENIEITWKTFEEVKKLCKIGEVKEDRSLGMLFRFFLQYPERYTSRTSA